MEPKVVYIETTNLCNAKCIMCPHEKLNRQPAIMTDDIFDKAIDECKKMDLKNAQFFLHKEGEPLMDPQIMMRLRITATALAKNNEVGINTNASLFNNKKAEEFLESGANVIFFSVDGTNKEEYEKIRVNLKYEVVENNVRYFLKRCKEVNANIRVVMQMVVESKDENKSQAFIEKWREYPCEFYIKRMHGYLDGGRSSQTSELKNEQVNICDDPFRLMVIYTNGNVGLCCWDYNNEYCIGNIRDSGLADLFNNEKAKALRTAIIKRDCSNVIPCNRCAKVFGNDKITPW